MLWKEHLKYFYSANYFRTDTDKFLLINGRFKTKDIAKDAVNFFYLHFPGIIGTSKDQLKALRKEKRSSGCLSALGR